MEWRGAGLLPIQIFVCEHCYDTPQEQFRAIVLPADPVPVLLPFPEPFMADEINVMTLTTGSTTDPVTGLPIPATTTLTTVPGVSMTPEPYGRPDGLEQPAVMPFGVGQTVQRANPLAVPLSLISVTANGTDQISVTCSKAHGLVTNNQIAVEGLSNGLANGFFSVVVTGAMSFTYQTYAVSVPNGGLLTPRTLMITADVGLPRDYSTIQQVGP
jgi:hypothetical protein